MYNFSKHFHKSQGGKIIIIHPNMFEEGEGGGICYFFQTESCCVSDTCIPVKMHLKTIS